MGKHEESLLACRWLLCSSKVPHEPIPEKEWLDVAGVIVPARGVEVIIGNRRKSSRKTVLRNRMGGGVRGGYGPLLDCRQVPIAIPRVKTDSIGEKVYFLSLGKRLLPRQKK